MTWHFVDVDFIVKSISIVGFPNGAVVKTLRAIAGDLGLKYPLGEGRGNPLQHACLGNSMDRGAWWAIVYRATKTQTWLVTASDTFSVWDSKVFEFPNITLSYLENS